MKILVTGKNGFIAKNVIDFFSQEYEVLSVSHTDNDLKLEEYCVLCDFVFHLAAVQRSNNSIDFFDGNVKYTEKLINFLKKNEKKPPIIFSTSIGIDQPTNFASTKLRAEKLLRTFSNTNGNKLYVFKLNHIFGRYGKPNFNNVIATFCYNVVNGLPITINDPASKLEFTYIEDLMNDFRLYINDNAECDSYIECSIKYKKTLGQIAMILGEIKNKTFNINDDFQNKLNKTYCFYELEKKE